MPSQVWSYPWMPLMPDRRPSYRRGAAGGLVFLLLLIGASRGAEPPALDPQRNPDEASSEEGPISVEELARRLQRLEQQNAKLLWQNNQLAGQNAKLTAQYDQLNRRVESWTPDAAASSSLSSALAPSSSERPTAQEASITPDDPPFPFSPFSNARSSESEGAPANTFFPNIASRAEPESPDRAAPEASDTSPTAEPTRSWLSKFLIGGYDEERGGFVLVRSQDAQRVPFELRLDLVTQVRYTNFAPSASTFTNSTGAAQPIQRISSWEINRNFIQFSGFALDPRLQYMAILFSSTAFNDTVLLGYLSYHFSDAFDLRAGNWLVPGTREWYTSFRYTLGADRLMATTFFRPNISPGLWVQGEPIKGFNYVVMVANSLNRFNQGIDRIGSSFAFGGTARWEPLGDFGLGPSDIENHQSLSTRLGVNLAVSRESNQGSIETDGNITDPRLANPEDTFLRLSNGTPVFQPGALGPGVTLTATNVQMWTVDAAFKYRGLSLDGEYFFRWLDSFRAVGNAPSFSSLFDYGALLQGGCFWIPTKLESYARSSVVSGRFGTGSEFGGGINWYPKGSRAWRLTAEVLYINHCPADNPLTGYRAGESGTLLQLQWFTDF